MKHFTQRRSFQRTAFTLIELLVVIAVISILAALIFPVTKGLKIKRTIAVAQAELAEVQTAIDSYKNKLGTYPPDNALNTTPAGVNPVLNPLYFELAGTTNDGQLYITLDGSGQIATAAFQSVYSPSGPATTVVGFMNSSTSARGTDDKPGPVNFLKDFRPNQIGQLTINNTNLNAILVCSVGWPDTPTEPIHTPIETPSGIAATDGLNPWRYVSSNPTNNPGSYDLWVDIPLAGKTYRVSNWSKQPQIF